ncbi:uncharacterized protein IL334_005261 [Kwoniella shivajii]|uniref:Uncharacterized protein n=1 Tax=Kwoniella shivajii TaxID=564305 RepID=A0ABZ1D4F7_9TREE|nr:hypothetical protein IL334_005261 [Kwoniella shivajii]
MQNQPPRTYATGLPDTPDFSGVNFVIRTSSPPLLLDYIYSNGIISHQEQDSSSTFFLKRYLFRAPYYFSSFRSESGLKMSISRQELSRAWVIGLNAMRFHARSIRYLDKWGGCGIDDSILVDLKDQLMTTGKEWQGCWKELDWAMGILEQFETARYVPEEWVSCKSYDIRNLLETTKSNHNDRTLQYISDTFIYAAVHLLNLDKEGYKKEYLTLAEKTGLDLESIRYCYVPNLDLLPPKPRFNDEHGKITNIG